MKQNAKKVDKIAFVPTDDLAISCFNLTELLYDTYNSEYVEKNLKRVHYIENTIEVLPFDKKSVENYAAIKANFRVFTVTAGDVSDIRSTLVLLF